MRWGKLLLPAGLLLVAVAGFLNLYEVQVVLFPGNYHATKLKLIRMECNFIEKGLIALQTKVAELNAFCVTTKRLTPIPTSPSSAGVALPQSHNDERITSKADWAPLYAAKKKRVYVARKLRYIDAMLQAMQRAIEQQSTSHNVSLAKKRFDLEKTLPQIRKIRTRYQTYSSELDKLTEKLNQLEDCSNNSFVKTE